MDSLNLMTGIAISLFMLLMLLGLFTLLDRGSQIQKFCEDKGFDEGFINIVSGGSCVKYSGHFYQERNVVEKGGRFYFEKVGN